jgi:hypothetical protein
MIGGWGLLLKNGNNMKTNVFDILDIEIDGDKKEPINKDWSRLLAGKKKRERKHKKKPKDRKYRRVPKQYTTYVNSRWWSKRKNRYWKNHRKICCRCFSTVMVQLHHGEYDSSIYGREPDKVMFPLCHVCHEEFHERYGVKKTMIKETKEFIKEI